MQKLQQKNVALKNMQLESLNNMTDISALKHFLEQKMSLLLPFLDQVFSLSLSLRLEKLFKYSQETDYPLMTTN